MKGRHAASGWSPFWRDILLRAFLVVLLVAMAVFIWWLFSEDDLFTETVSTTSDPAPETSVQDPSTTSATVAPSTTVTTATGDTSDTTVDEPATTTSSPPTSTTTTTVPPPLGPDELVVRVLNANGVQGVAGRTTTLIEEAGYGTVRAGNHELRIDRSEVLYQEGFEREAEQLRVALVPDATLTVMTADHEESPHAEGVHLLVMLGRSFEE